MLSHVPFSDLMDYSWQAPLSMGFSRQGYWSGLSCPPPGDLPDPEIFTGRFFTAEPSGKPPNHRTYRECPKDILKNASESDSIMTQILELSEREFKITVAEKADNFQEQMGNRSSVMETPRTKRKH